MSKFKIYFSLIISLFIILSGCSSAQLANEAPNKNFQSNLEENNNNHDESINPYNYKDLSSLPKEYSFDIAKENGDVVWSFKRIYNLERLDNFVNNVKNGQKDMIRVVAFTKEGDPIIEDLLYDGEAIRVTCDSTRDEFSANPSISSYEYEQIVIEKKYNEHYESNFIEYILKDTSGEKSSLVLQIIEKEVAFKTVDKGYYCGIGQNKNIVIKDTQEWTNTWKDLLSNTNYQKSKNINFENKTIIAVFMGERNSGGYSIEIKNVVENGNQLIVSYIENSPSADSMVTMALTQPFHVIEIDKTDKEIVFEKIKE